MSQQNLQKFKYRIIEFSSEELDYPAQELLVQSPTCKGWQSARFCDYPQQMTIQFMNPVRLKQVQILSHQSKITSKIEIYTYLPDFNSNRDQNEIKYKKLGYLNLDTNEKTGFQSRELKSVYIDNPCLYIKFIFHKHHVNKFNLFNQIGIIALSCFGEYIQQQNQIKNQIDNKQDFQLDQLTLDKLKALQLAKENAIQNEDFEEAKRLKDAIERLKQIAVQLQQLEERKNIAIQNDDFDNARIIKAEADRLRSVIGPEQLIQINSIKSKPQIQNQYAQKNIQNDAQQQPQYNPIDQNYQMPQSQYQNQNQMPRNQQQFKHQYQYEPSMEDAEESKQQSYPAKNQQNYQVQNNQAQNLEDFDEQIIPARQNNKQQQQNEFQDEENQQVGKAEPLSQQAQKLADPLIGVLGQDLCRKIFSKTWQIREEGIKELEGEIQHPKFINTDDKNEMFTSIFVACYYAIADKIVQVQTAGMFALQTLCQQRTCSNKNSFLLQYIDKLIEILLEKIGETNPRVQKTAEECLFSLGGCTIIGNNYITTSIATGSSLKPKFQTSPKHIVARNSLLEQFVKKFKIGNKEVTLEVVVDFAVKSVSNSNKDVRKEAVKLIGTINSCIGQNMLRPLLEGIPQQQMDIIEGVIGNIGVDLPKKEIPKQYIETNINNGKKKQENPKKVEDKGKICEFCGKMDKQFLDQNKMDIHLWKECPFLTICEGCQQVVEIPTYGQHLVEECDNKKSFKKCPRCKESVHNQFYKQHCDLMKCSIPKQQTNRCPLCHQDISAGIQGWKTHLISEGCPKNNRQI